jgi:hypothetical protein
MAQATAATQSLSILRRVTTDVGCFPELILTSAFAL